MGEITGVTDGQNLLVRLLDIKRSKFWPMAERLWSEQEDRDDIGGDMLVEAKKEFLSAVNKVETAWDSNENQKSDARKCIVNIVGREIVMAAQLSRVRFDEASYESIMKRLDKKIDKFILNLKTQRSPATIVNVQPQMLDPDSDYPDDITDG